MRTKAAQEISRALRNGGLFKIIFVITLEAGRIRGDDKTTIRLVTQASPIGHFYSIIVNKLEPEIISLLQDPQQAKELITMLNDGLPGASAVYFNQLDLDLQAKNNVVPALSSELLAFINAAPTLLIPSEQVKDVRTNEFDEIKEKLEKELTLMAQSKDLLEIKAKEQAEKYEQIVRENKEQQEKMERQHTAQMNAMKQTFDRQIEEAKKQAKKKGGFALSIGPFTFRF